MWAILVLPVNTSIVTQKDVYIQQGYGIGSNPDFFNPAFVGRDHTTGTGNFMIINGAESGYKVWGKRLK